MKILPTPGFPTTALLLPMITLLLAGCSHFGETYRKPAIEVPTQWAGAASVAAPWPDHQWWSVFGSKELDQLVVDAQKDNHDLRAAIARVEQARANARIAGAVLYPNVSIAADIQRSKSSGTPAGNRVTLAPQVSYEIDLWGRRRFEAETSEASLKSSEFAREVVRLTLTADVAATYFQLLSLNDRIAVAESNLVLAESLIKLLEAQKAAGRASAFEVERQRSQVATTAAALPPLRQQRQLARDALALLLGRSPAAAPDPQGSLRALGVPATGVGLPSELLERRPDVRRAEANLQAAHADVAAARAAVFPKIDLSARGGWQSTAVGSLFDPGKSFYSLVAGLVGTLFDGGQLAGQVDLAQARRTELVETYLQTVLASFRDVEDALAGVEQLSRQESLQEQAAVSARESYRLAELRYKAGATDYATVLDAQRTLLSAESAVDQARFSRFSNVVDLYRALGGGWDGRGEDTPRPVSGTRKS